jgi:hypothetical protein
MNEELYRLEERHTVLHDLPENKYDTNLAIFFDDNWNRCRSDEVNSVEFSLE